MPKRFSLALSMTAMVLAVSGAIGSLGAIRTSGVNEPVECSHGTYQCSRAALAVGDLQTSGTNTKPLILNYGQTQSSSTRGIYTPGTSNRSSEDYLKEMIAGEGIGRWEGNRLPLKVFVESGNRVSGYKASFKAQMIDALNEWTEATSGKLAWTEVSNPQEADIVFGWTSKVNNQRPDEAGFTMAEARNNGKSAVRTMGKATVTILTHYKGKVLTDRDMRKVCLHELGHAFGMQGHSPFSNDIMYATTSRNQGERLSQRDITSMRSLYDMDSAPMQIGSR